MLLHSKLALYHPSFPQKKALYVTSLSKSIPEKRDMGYEKKRKKPMLKA
jgi:hypothetical protein